MLALGLTLIAAGLMIGAFPPYELPFAAIVSLTVLLVGLRRATSGRWAAVLGGIFGFVFVAGQMIWLRNLAVGLADVAWLLLGVVHVPLFALFGWIAHRVRAERVLVRGAIVIGAWVGVFAVMRWLPTFSLEWADPGYTVAPFAAARDVASLIGATGWTVLLAIGSVGLAATVESRDPQPAMRALGTVAIALAVGAAMQTGARGAEYDVTIVQGNSPCPQVGCAGERTLIAQNHLDLTRQLEPGSQDLVVWAESSTGYSTDARTHEAWAEAIGAEARRLDAFVLQGTDRAVEDRWFVNANVVFDPSGVIVGEYRKQHPVPFGEQVPWRSVFGGLPGMRSSDMLPGDGPVVFDMDGVKVGSVISFEGAFGRYARAHAANGAQLLVVATNESSYGEGAAADQLIWMTSMRSAELGMDVIHAAITGASTIIRDGEPGEVTALYEEAVVTDTVLLREQGPTAYTRFGDWFPALAMILGGAAFTWRAIRDATPVAPPARTE